ncbi:MAG: hypothetical protein ACE5LD_01905, partial [Candidatus Bipolaricaulia bacterium]
LGGFAEYKRNLGGVLLSYRPTDYLTLSLDLLQAADSPASGVDRSSLRTMPNDHIVGGLSAVLDLGGFQAGLEFGYNYNRFPFDDNERKNRLNRINAVRAIRYQGREYVLFGNQNGLAVFDGRRWREIGPAEGLAGHAVRDIAVADDLLIFATDSGVSLLRLAGEDPFAILTNWRRFYKQDGLSSQDVYAALIWDGILYLGTAEGLNRVPLDGIEDKESWTVYRKGVYPQMITERISTIAGEGKRIYLGTDQGLMIFDPKAESFAAPPELEGVRINGLFAQGGEVLVATDLGVRLFDRGRGSGWLPMPGPIRSVATAGGNVWFGTEEGLYRMGEEEPLVQARITALSPGDSGLWLGTEATADYELTLWQVRADGVVQSYPQSETRIDGRDRHHFQDIPAAEHTDRGLAAVLSLTQKLGKLKLKGSLKNISPQFAALGSQARQDLKGWSLEGDWEITPKLSLEVNHEANLEGAELAISEPLGRKSYSEKDSLGMRWEIGPQLELGYSLERIDNRGQDDGFDEARHNLTTAIQSSLLNGRLGLSLSYDLLSLINLRWASRSSQEHSLAAEVDFQLLPGLNITWRYSRPVKVARYGERRRSWGSEELGISARWSQVFPLVSVNAEYNRDSRRRIPPREGEGEADQDGQLELQFDSLELGELTLQPRGNLSFEQQERRISLGGEGELRGEFDAFKGQASYKLSSTLDEWSRRKDFLHNFSLRLDYGGWKDLSPSLGLQGTVRVLQHPSYGKKTLENWTASAGLGWKSSNISNNTSLSRARVKNDRENTTSYSLRNVTNFALPYLPQLSSSLEATGSYTLGDREGQRVNNLKGELSLKEDYPLGGQ